MSSTTVTINHPDDIDGVEMPIYEGPADQAFTKLAPGIYRTTDPDVAVAVYDDRSIPFTGDIADMGAKTDAQGKHTGDGLKEAE